MKKIIIGFASALALVFTALADEVIPPSWFDAMDFEEWPEDGADLEINNVGTWSNTKSATYENSVLSLDTAENENKSLIFTASSSKAIADEKVIVKTFVSFTPYDSNDVPAVPSGSKGAVCVGFDADDNLNYYVVAKDATAETPVNVWVKVDGVEVDPAATNGGVEVSFTFETNPDDANSVKTTYFVGNTTLGEYDVIVSDKTISSAGFLGTGKISSVSADAELRVVELVLPELPAGMEIAKIEVDGNVITATNGKYLIKPGSSVKVTYGAIEGYVMGATNSQTFTMPIDGIYTFDSKNITVSKDGVATDGTTIYVTLNEAIEKASGTVTLLKNITLDAPVVVEKTVILDLAGYEIVAKDFEEEAKTVYPMIRIQGGATLTVKNGNIINPDDYVFTLGSSDKSESGNLIIESGSYYGNCVVASVTKGTLTINGGVFEINPKYDTFDYKYVINCYDENYINGSAKVFINGGEFINFNPFVLSELTAVRYTSAGVGVNSAVSGGNTIYTAVKNKGAQLITAAGAYVAYDDISAAIVDAKSGDTVCLLRDITLAASENVIVPEGVTLDLAGKAITVPSGVLLGRVVVNGGKAVLNGVDLIGKACNYATEDAVYTQTTTSLQLESGTITLASDMRAAENGQSIEINSGASFVIPDGKSLHLYGKVIANGNITVGGTIKFFEGATLTCSADILAKCISMVEGKSVKYVGGVYKLEKETDTSWPANWNDGSQPASLKDKFAAWVAEGNDMTLENAESAFLLGVAVEEYIEEFKAVSIVVENGSVKIAGNYDLDNVNGAIYIKSSDTPEGVDGAEAMPVTFVDGEVSINAAEGETKKFYKLVVGYPAD